MLCNIIPSWKVCFINIALELLPVTGLISNLFRSFMKISLSLTQFGIFIANKGEGIPQLALRILPKKKLTNQTSRQAATRF